MPRKTALLLALVLVLVAAGIGLLEQRVVSQGTLEEAYLNLVRD
jgi:hypothetical protein